jgi:hypothetical protein
MCEPNLLGVLTNRLFQIAFVVSDLEAAEDTWGKLGGSGFSSPEGHLAQTVTETFRDQPTGPSALSVRLGMLGKLQLELVQFESGESSYGDFVARHGTGLHHLGFLAESVDEFHRLEHQLRAAGVASVQAGQAADGTLYTYFDADALLGCYLMLVYPGHRLSAFYQRVALVTDRVD